MGQATRGPATPGPTTATPAIREASRTRSFPEDLQATEDNPLARHPRQTGDEDDKIGAESETGDAANPSASMTYGEDDDSEEGSSNTSDEGDGDDGDTDS